MRSRLLTGSYTFTVAPGLYTVREACQASWEQSLPAPTNGCGSGVYGMTLTSGQLESDNDFGNFRLVDLHAHKFFDFNEYMVQDGNEDNLAGIEFTLTGMDGMGGEVGPLVADND